jgi:hypothetical protein
LGASVARIDSHCIAQQAFSFPVFAELPLKEAKHDQCKEKFGVNFERATIQAFGIGKFARLMRGNSLTEHFQRNWWRWLQGIRQFL